MSKTYDSEYYRVKLIDLLNNFQHNIKNDDLRNQVISLIPATKLLQSLGKSLISDALSARDRILSYFKKYVGVVISGDELYVISGISEYARRVRELRVQYGWKIVSGVTLKFLQDEEKSQINIEKLGPNQYILLSDVQDTESAYRWNVAHDIRISKLSSREKIITFFRKFVGKQITGEELSYVAGGNTEWARRVRELRTEYGWPIVTKSTGRPDLPIGIYLLEEDRQAPEHDRKIPEDVYRRVLVRDKYTCQDCGWNVSMWNTSDPRHLEVHHIHFHIFGGENTDNNLITLCNICHDVRHRKPQI